MLGHDKIKLKVPTFIAGGDVMIDGVIDSTSIYRGSGLLGRPHNQRTHRRILTTPIGEPLTNFRSKTEFIMSMITVVLAHQYLCETLHILHRDISIGNILLYRPQEGQEATGLLVDFDFSASFNPKKASESVPDGNLEASEAHNNISPTDYEVDATGSGSNSYDGSQSNSMNITDREDRIWTGTPPFVAIEALITFPQPFIHQPRHDLESILYVILYICTYFKGPGIMRTATDFPEFRSVPLERCFRHDGIRDIGRCKIGLMSTFKTSLLPKFTPYWADFTPFVQQLIETCFPSIPDFRNGLTHDNMLTILREAYDTIEEPLPESVKATESIKRSSRPSQAKKPEESNTNVASGSRISKRRKVDG